MFYQSGSLRLSKDEKKLISRLKYLTNFCLPNYPPVSIRFGSRTYNGLRPNFYAYTNDEFKQTHYELAESLAYKLGIQHPYILPYCDIHSAYDVPWHQDNSTFNRANVHDKYFFDEPSPCLKFYFKFKFSFYDLCALGENEKINFLESSFENISYFDVRASHRTYFNPKLAGFSLLPKSKSLFKLTRHVTSILNFFQLDSTILSSNFYFMVAANHEVWREYCSREEVRSFNQIQSSHSLQTLLNNA